MLTNRLLICISSIIIALLVYTIPTANALSDGIDTFFDQLIDSTGSNILPPDQAFSASAHFTAENHLKVHWQIAEGYYLYKDKFNFSFADDNISISNITLPQGIYKEDPEFGNVWVYYDNVDAGLTLVTNDQDMTASEVVVTYQGCKEDVLCYPPISKTLLITPLIKDANQDSIASIQSAQTQLPPSDMLGNRLLDGNLFYTIMIFFGFGFVLSLTPCIFPMIPILSGIIVSQAQHKKPLYSFYMSLTYVIAMAATFAVLGIISGSFAINLQATAQNVWIITAFSSIFVLLALSMFGFYDLRLPTSWSSKLTKASDAQGNSLKGVAIMGILSAIIVGPCVAPPLAAALLYISQTGDAVLGGTALFAMGLGMGATLLVIGTSVGKLLPKSGAWMISIKYIFGVLMLGTAIWFMARVLPAPLVLILWALLLMVSAVYMGALDRGSDLSQWQKLWRGLGLAMFTYGVILMVGAANNNSNVFKPLSGILSNHQTTSANAGTLAFQTIKGHDNLQTALQKAQRNNMPVMLDFYADWCISCKEMEHGAFADPNVHQALQNTILLQADVTKYDAQDKALLKKFGLYGPPAILFFDPSGIEQQSHRVIGFMNSADFLQHIKNALHL